MVDGVEIRSFAIGRMEFQYQQPNITAVTVDSIAGSSGGLNTKGFGSGSAHELNSKFVITGTDLGNDPSAVVVYVGRQTASSSEFRFSTAVIESANHESLLVGAPEGIGVDLQIRISIGGQIVDGPDGQTVTYAPPVVTGVRSGITSSYTYNHNLEPEGWTWEAEY